MEDCEEDGKIILNKIVGKWIMMK